MFKKFRGNKKAYIIRIFFAALIFILSILAFLPDYKPFTAIMELNPGPAVAKWISDFSIITLIVVLLHFAIAFLFGRFYCSTVCPFGILQDIIGGILLSFFASFAILFAVLMIFNKYILNTFCCIVFYLFLSL